METLAFIALLNRIGNWQAITDILVIAAGLFFLYRTLLRLGTWRIFAGIIVAVCIFSLANILNLKGLEWIFGNLSQVALVALIVIFQPELRKIFERAASLRRSEIRDLGSEVSQIIVDSLVKMAEQRRGAIVVFPGKEPLEEWLAGGYKLDARPSKPLIMSIFDPNSPGHDGALIVERGKFTRFGVRLPISQTSKLPEELGTRHHAAMGIAEKSDALAIAVSEERGKITVFTKGKFKQQNDREKLVEAILSHWKKTASFPLKLPEGKARWLVFSQLLASLVLAVFLWSSLIIAQSQILERIVSVPVGYSASPPNLTLVGDRQREVRLHLAGPKSELDAMNLAQLSAKINLAKTEAGKQTFPITAENIKLPEDVRLLEVVPSSIELVLAEIEEQEVTIKPQLVGKLPGGMKIISIEVSPEKLMVLSPVSGGKKLAAVSVMTTPIYLESIYNDTSIFCKIIAPPGVQPVDKRWPDVEVVIKVGY